MHAVEEREAKRITKTEIQFRCPAHSPDNNPSATYDTKKHVWHCHACKEGGGWIDLAQRLSATIYQEPPAPTPRRKPEIVATWDYTDETGKFLFQIVKWVPGKGRVAKGKPQRDKSFQQRQLREDGTWQWNLDGVERVLYNLPAVTNANLVIITEGEKDADSLIRLGHTATTNPGGARNWNDAYTAALKNKTVIIMPDNDEAGLNHLNTVGLALHRTSTVLVAQVPHQKKDITDYIQAGATPGDVQLLIDHATPFIPPRNPLDQDRHPHTDLGNARRLTERFGQDLRYSHAWNQWLTWDGRHWEPDDTGAAERHAKEIADTLLEDSALLKDINFEKGEALEKHARRTQSRRSIQDMLTLAQTEPGIPVRIDNLDQDPLALTVNNGTIDLTTGQLRPHDRADLITKLIPITHNPEADCPVWLATLHYIFRGDEEILDFFQRFTGYTMTGLVTEQILLIAYGTGANGKSTVTTILQELLGPYAVQANPNLLMAKDRDTHPTEIASLYGKRLAIASELEQGKAFAEVTVKQLTGGDKITARRMREDFWEFNPTHKILIATNHKPVIRGTDHAIWRRIRLLPFTVTIPPEKRDPNLPALLRTELPGILNWAIEGARKYLEDGLPTPAAVMEATASYETEMDMLGDFIQECCHINPGGFAKAADVYTTYQRWAISSGYRPLGKKNFNQQFSDRGTGQWELRRGNYNILNWYGLTLIEDHVTEGGDQQPRYWHN